jgi:hypothetical protein
MQISAPQRLGVFLKFAFAFDCKGITPYETAGTIWRVQAV